MYNDNIFDILSKKFKEARNNLNYESLTKLYKVILPALRYRIREHKKNGYNYIMLPPNLNAELLERTPFSDLNAIYAIDYEHSELLKNEDFLNLFVTRCFDRKNTGNEVRYRVSDYVRKMQQDYFSGGSSYCGNSDLFLRDEDLYEIMLFPNFDELILCDKDGNPGMSFTKEDLTIFTDRTFSSCGDDRHIDGWGNFYGLSTIDKKIIKEHIFNKIAERLGTEPPYTRKRTQKHDKKVTFEEIG